MSPVFLLFFAGVASAVTSTSCADGECDVDIPESAIPESATSLLAKVNRREQVVSDIVTDKKHTTQTENTVDLPDPSLLRWDSRGTLNSGGEAMWGWLKVPLSHAAEENIYDVKHVCLRVRGITATRKDLTKPKKVMFVHCGGPGTGRGCDVGIDERMLKEYDVITMNQRGHSLFSGMGSDSKDAEPPVCPFTDESGKKLDAFPVISCSELALEHNFQKIPEWTGESETSEIYKEFIDPIVKEGGSQGNFYAALFSGNETAMRWAIRLAKLEYNLCYKNPRYQFWSSTSHRVSSAFDYTGTSNLVHDMNVFRKAVGADKLTCYGISYGTQVCSNFATIYPESTGKMILDANVEPRPDVISLADEAAEGPMAVFRGIAAACEASLVSDDKESVCPMAPFMAEKVHAAMNSNPLKKELISKVWGAYSGQKDVPCAAVMMSCMSYIIKGGLKPAGCNNSLGSLIEKHLHPTQVSSNPPGLHQLQDMFNEKDQTPKPHAVHAALANVKAVLRQKHVQQPIHMEFVPQDTFGLASIMAVSAMDIHGRLTEPGIIKWWRDAASRFTMGLDRGLFFAVGVSIWPAIPTPVPPAGDSELKPLIIGNLRDKATSYIATQRMKQGFPQGRLLTYQGYGHGLTGGSFDNEQAEQSCGKHVFAYLYDDILPEDGSTCAVLTTAKTSKRDAEYQQQFC